MDESIRWEQCAHCYEWHPFEEMVWDDLATIWVCQACSPIVYVW